VNGIPERVCAPIASENIVAPLTEGWGATDLPSLWPRATAPVTSFAMARLLWACHTPHGRRLLPSHGRVALRDTTVPNSTWQASPDAVPQMRTCPSTWPCAGQHPLSRHSSDTSLLGSFKMIIWNCCLRVFYTATSYCFAYASMRPRNMR
jgi:hypothetical protein